MELTPSFLALLQHFSPIFTAPTYQTFALIVTGWILSHRHRYITEVIFSCGKVGIGHWCRFHRFFSHAAWDLDEVSMVLAKLVVTILAPGATFLWAVDDTLCRKRGLIPNYGDRHRHGEAISTAFAESTVNQVISKRMVKKQQMRWTERGAHLLLQVRTQVLNEDLRTTFQRWYPGMKADTSQAEEVAA
jgi:hypothetical protein